jgi:hypothetical protein
MIDIKFYASETLAYYERNGVFAITYTEARNEVDSMFPFLRKDDLDSIARLVAKKLDGSEFESGNRVQIAPHYDLFMRGARYGEIRKIVGGIAHIKMDHPQVKKLARIPLTDIRRIQNV